MVTVGIAGLGPDWESCFRPALRKLRERIAVRAVYDSVATRAGQTAEEWDAEPVDGLLALAERTDVRALLLLDAGWQKWEAVRLLCSQGKPVFIASGLCHDQSALKLLYDRARSSGQTLMPAFGLRYTPASCRLRELMATRLGPPRSVTVAAAPPATAEQEAHELFVNLADWCRYVAGASPVRLQAISSGDDAEADSTVQLDFGGDAGKGASVRGELRLPGLKLPSAQGNGSAGGFSAARLQATIVCAHGTATIEAPTRIAWQTGSESMSETLASERTETEVMLDLFCRRVVGGLIPVADVSDVLRGARLLEGTWRSLATGRPVDFQPST